MQTQDISDVSSPTGTSPPIQKKMTAVPQNPPCGVC